MCVCPSLVRVDLREAPAHVLFWVYSQKGTHGVFMMDEIIETRQKGRITRSTTKHNRIKSSKPSKWSGHGQGHGRSNRMTGLLTCVSLFVISIAIRDNINLHQPSEHFDLIQLLCPYRLKPSGPSVLGASESRSAYRLALRN